MSRRRRRKSKQKPAPRVRAVQERNPDWLEITISPWLPLDAPCIREMLKSYLIERTGKLANDILPNDDNVEMLLGLGMEWASRGLPSLAAIYDGEIVGIRLVGPMVTTMQMTHPQSLQSVLGYVLPEYRGQGVILQLDREAEDIGRDLGMTRIMGSVSMADHRIMKNMDDKDRHPNATAVAVVYERIL